MSGFPGSPRLLKGGIVLVDGDSGAIRRVIALHYNPDTLTRSLQPNLVAGGRSSRSEATRLKGPPVETVKLDAELDASDQLEVGDLGVIEVGLHPQLAALETIVYPTAEQLQQQRRLADGGALEIAPVLAPLTLFVWSKQRIVPVQLTDLSITEEAFDPNLNPIRAKVAMSLRVLSVDDLGFDDKGGSLYMAYLQNKERLASRSASGSLAAIGLTGAAVNVPGHPSFAPTSRYATVETAAHTDADGREIIYVRRRFVGPPEHFADVAEHFVAEGDRLDNITAQHLGDPEQFWRICDANVALRPDELTEELGRPLRITLPEGVPGPGHDG